MDNPESATAETDSGTEDSSSQNELTTIVGGEEIEVTLENGSKERVKVRQVPISQIQILAIAVTWGNMADEIAIYCNKEKQWVDSLTHESAALIAKKGQGLNLPFLRDWSEHKAKSIGVVQKDRIAELEAELAAERMKSALLISAQASPSTIKSSPPK